jgi:hypothetical protein
MNVPPENIDVHPENMNVPPENMDAPRGESLKTGMYGGNPYL